MISSEKELIRQALNCQAYEEAIDLLSQAIEGHNEQLGLYWDLGLAYLFNHQSDEAENIWLAGITKSWELGLGDRVEQLACYLLTEIELQQEQANYDNVWLLRCQLQNLEPENCDNTLRLICLSHDLGKLSPEYLAEWDVVERLISAKIEAVNSELLLDCVLEVLRYPTALSIDFLNASTQFLEKLDWLNPVMQWSEEVATRQKRLSYAIDLVSVCLQHHPKNLYVIHRLMSYYGLIGDETKVAEFAQLLYECQDENNQDVIKNCFIYSRVALSWLAQANWRKIEETRIIQKLKSSIQRLAKLDNIVFCEFIVPRFWAIAMPFVYLQDNPAENRKFLNITVSLFQFHYLRGIEKEKTPAVKLPSKNLRNKLRVGYIGHTFRKHSVGWLSRWLFHYHDRHQFEIYVYLVAQDNDELTEAWILPNAHKVVSVDRDAPTIAQIIREDNLDLLVEVDGLTNNTVAQVLALKPAPIQATWLGSDASGLPAIDYFLVDKLVLPPENQQYYRERLWYLPQTYIAVDGFEVGTRTITRENLGIAEDAVIYLTVQYSTKYSPKMATLHLEILQSVPQSVLLIKDRTRSGELRRLIEKMALEMGIEHNRLIFTGRDPDEATHRANLALADIVLDTYPYSGATTTLETLWMGIPLVTWVGEQFSARNSYAFMRQVGVLAGIAHNAKEYKEWAMRLGTDGAMRQEIHQTLVQARHTSPLWQGEAFTRAMENAYRQIIEKFLTGNDHSDEGVG
jgi:predicted O-linked N-acetylglucosamine transferase (SPINDLY family)